ncbi:MAG: RnfABCDGE type electron transport complex subunit C [Desulfohalobiaceae bacterium]|nr:RnfABCDGE type electron transport complex subunit C [Desulfohalobiaceae bacterium]
MRPRSFSGGLLLPSSSRSEPQPFEHVPFPETFFLPMKQHKGAGCRPLFKKDAAVQRGQILGQSSETAIQSPVSGHITEVNKGFRHLDGSITTCLTLAASEEAEQTTPAAQKAPVMDKILGSGVLDFGPAQPLMRKLIRAQERGVRTLIINSLDEFFVFGSRSALLVHHTSRAMEGIRLLQHMLQPETTYLAVYEQSLPLLDKDIPIPDSVRVVPLRAKHPQYKDPMLVSALTGQEYPMESSPLELGIASISLETASTLAAVVNHDEPNTHKPLTVLGPEPKEQNNVLVPLGSPIRHLLQHLGRESEDVAKVIVGGPLTGTALSSLDYPVTKEMDQIHFHRAKDQISYSSEVCVKCGYCVEVCPMRLMPFLLSGYSSTGFVDMAADNDIFSCIECGCCAYVCPVNIPLVQWIQVGKSRLSTNLRSEAV